MIKIKEAVGIFNNNNELQATIDELSISGFDRLEMSVIGSEKSMKEKFNVQYKDPKDLVDNSKTPRDVNVSTEEIGVVEGAVISGGILAGVVTSLIAIGSVTGPRIVPASILGATAGSALGLALAKLIGNSHAQHLEKQIEAGGLVLWVRTDNIAKENLSTTILAKHGAKDVHLHDIELEEMSC